MAAQSPIDTANIPAVQWRSSIVIVLPYLFGLGLERTTVLRTPELYSGCDLYG